MLRRLGAGNWQSTLFCRPCFQWPWSWFFCGLVRGWITESLGFVPLPSPSSAPFSFVFTDGYPHRDQTAPHTEPAGVLVCKTYASCTKLKQEYQDFSFWFPPTHTYTYNCCVLLYGCWDSLIIYLKHISSIEIVALWLFFLTYLG